MDNDNLQVLLFADILLQQEVFRIQSLCICVKTMVMGFLIFDLEVSMETAPLRARFTATVIKDPQPPSDWSTEHLF
jgi:hypothetical protein